MARVSSLEHLAAIAHGRTGGGFPEECDIEPGDALHKTIMRIKREAYGRGQGGEMVMIMKAARVGDEKFLLHEAGASKRCLIWMMLGAAEGGHEHLCRLAKEWGATMFDVMLKGAAEGGHEHLCRLAKEWGATTFNGMLAAAAYGGHAHLCRLAVEWGATRFNWMLRGAAHGGHEYLCRIAKELGATDFGEMWLRADCGGHERLCRLAEEWVGKQRRHVNYQRVEEEPEVWPALEWMGEQ
jgi:hypothetical protein